MDATWLETVGRLAVPTYLALVVGLIGAAAFRALRASRPIGLAESRRSPSVDALNGHGRSMQRIVEYVGNVGSEEHLGEERGANLGLRTLLDEVQREFERRAVPHDVRQTFLDELREAIQSERQLLESPSGADEMERRFLTARRWELAQRLDALLKDPPPEIVAGLRSMPFAEDPRRPLSVDAE